MSEKWEVIKAHKRKDGFEVTITLNQEGSEPVYEVDMWTKNDFNHWHKDFTTREEAEAEFKRWEND